MSINYLHGIETIEENSILANVSEVKSAVIGLIGTAPKGPVNTPTVIQNQRDAAQFGSFDEYGLTSGYTIPYALAAIQEYGAGTVIVINVFAPGTEETPNDIEDVVPATIIGTTDIAGHRTGAQTLLDCFSLFGFNPKIIIAPGFVSTAVVYDALLNIAEKVRAVVLVDMPAGLSVNQAIEARGTGAQASMAITSDRAYLLYPQLKHYDIETDTDQLMPYSVSMAGLIAKTDRDKGYWYSPSNKELKNIAGLEVTLTGSYTDETSDVQLLNEKGITSVLNAYGTGYRAYGNRLASFINVNTHGLESFLTTRRVSDMIAESLEQAMAQFVDVPLTAAIINDIVAVGNNFMNTLVSRGAIIGGSCSASPDNTAESLSQGHLTLIYDYTPPAPLERISHILVLTNSYYES